MKNVLLKKPFFFAIGIPFSILVFLILLVHSSYFIQAPQDLSIAITLDLVVTIPLLYFLLIRKTEISKLTVGSIFVLGIVIASFIIPPEQQSFLGLIKTFVFPMVEVGILGFLIFKTRNTIRQFKAQKDETSDFYSAVKKATQESFPGKAGNVLAMEIAMVYYLFHGQKRELSPEEYSYHKTSGIALAVYVFIGLIFAETFVVHLLVDRWNSSVAWVLTILSLYTCLQIFSLIRSRSKRPIRLDEQNKKLYLRYGFMSEATIDFEDIEKVELSARSLPEKEGMVKFSPLDLLDTHNIILYLNKEKTFTGFYGIQKKYSILAIYVDEKETFVDRLRIL